MLKKNTVSAIWIAFIIFLASLITLQDSYLDSDGWFILTTGKYILENGIPTTNVFTIHEGFDIIVQQWLFDVLQYGIYNHFGYLGIYIYVVAAFAGFCILFWILTKFWTDDPGKRLILLTIAAVVMLFFANDRPCLLTIIILTTELIFLEDYRKNNRYYGLYCFPILAVLETNLHASFFPFLFVFAVPFIFPKEVGKIKEIIAKIKVDLKVLCPFAVGLILGIITNPYGLKGAGYLFLSYRSAKNGDLITELQSPELTSPYGLITVAVVAVLFIYICKNKREISLWRCILAIGCIILAFTAKRNIIFLIFAFSLLADILPVFSIKLTKQKSRLFLLCIGITAAIELYYNPYDKENFNTIEDSELSAIAAADYLDELNPEEIILFTDFNSGAYMEWRGYKVYLDARPEIYEAAINGKEDIYTEYANLYMGKIDCDDFCEKYGFTHLLVQKYSNFDVYLSNNDDYTAVVEEDTYTLYEKYTQNVHK